MNLADYLKNSNLIIRVYPNSAKTKIKGYDDCRCKLLVDVAAPPEKGKANAEVVKFFSKLLKKKVEIKKGFKSRDKVLRIT